jgi:hypothetical protein
MCTAALRGVKSLFHRIFKSINLNIFLRRSLVKFCRQYTILQYLLKHSYPDFDYLARRIP